MCVNLHSRCVSFALVPYGSHRDDQRLPGQPALPIRNTEFDEDTVHDNSDVKHEEDRQEEDEKAAVDCSVDSDIKRDEETSHD